MKMNIMVKSAIKDAVLEALRVKPLKLISNGDEFEIYVLKNGIAYTEASAIHEILGKYSWYKD